MRRFGKQNDNYRAIAPLPCETRPSTCANAARCSPAPSPLAPLPHPHLCPVCSPGALLRAVEIPSDDSTFLPRCMCLLARRAPNVPLQVFLQSCPINFCVAHCMLHQRMSTLAPRSMSLSAPTPHRPPPCHMLPLLLAHHYSPAGAARIWRREFDCASSQDLSRTSQLHLAVVGS